MKKNKVVGVIQARLSSSRLPKKVLLPLGNENLVIDRVYNRLLLCRHIDAIYIATSNDDSDNELAEHCKKKKYNVFRGSLNDVLSRFSTIAKQSKATHIVRITGDCPLIEPSIIDACIIGCIANDYDLFGLMGNFPDGLDCQVFSSKSLIKANDKAVKISDKEHVGPFIENPKNGFKAGGIEIFLNHYNYRLTLDEQRDYDLLKTIFSSFNFNNYVSINDILHFLDSNEKVKSINSKIGRNEGYLKSLKND
jgi:glutamate-1-semialdehyde 2,1-aminomutase